MLQKGGKREVESVMENRVIRISVDGAEEYKREFQEMKKITEELREEVDKLNVSLEKEIELITKINQLR